MNEELIVCTPKDAIQAFMRNSVDILVMDNFVLVDKDIEIFD
ncbi:hypothetical protein IPdc08_00093 [archaeon]|nr:hypothetical protein IPdc08_00093 [archaeon]